jgi:fructose 5-dehydrogenase small subunit
MSLDDPVDGLPPDDPENKVAHDSHSPTADGAHNPERRAVLAALLAASAASVIPPALAAPTTDAAHDAFLAASKILTGRSSLDPDQASRLYDALLADDSQFAAGVQSLVTLIDQRKVDPLQLQHVLDSEHSTLAALPRKIVTAWYVGVVGDGEKARCITFETNLTNVIVSDKLKPASYCYGGYGSWAEKPA